MAGASSSSSAPARSGRLGSPIPIRKARIEIIPLIDIMFFLLASFMLVSLSMINMKSMKVSLPTSQASSAQSKSKDMVNVSVTKDGSVYLSTMGDGPRDLNKKLVARNEFSQILGAMFQVNTNTRVFIVGDKEVFHGDMMDVLGRVRAAGIQNVAFQVKDPTQAGTPSAK